MAVSIEQYAQAQKQAYTQARRHLQIWLKKNPNPTSHRLLQQLHELANLYGGAASMLAAEWYDQWRKDNGITLAYPDRPQSDPFTPEQIAHLLQTTGQTPDQLLTWMTSQRGRETLKARTKKDPAGVRWARKPIGKTCAFCIMLAGRGAVYLTKQTAGYSDSYHPDCDCQPMPYRQQQPPAWTQQYLDMYQQTGGNLAQMRRQFANQLTDGVHDDQEATK